MDKTVKQNKRTKIVQAPDDRTEIISGEFDETLSGTGELTTSFSNPDRMEESKGTFINGKLSGPNGQVTITDINLNTEQQTGTFEDGTLLNGEIKLSKFRGRYHDLVEEKIYTGTFEDGKLLGPGTVITRHIDKEEIETGTFTNGKLSGSCTVITRRFKEDRINIDSEKTQTGTFENGKLLDGEITFTGMNVDGTKMEEQIHGAFEDGKLSGPGITISRRFKEDGINIDSERIQTGTFRNGLLQTNDRFNIIITSFGPTGTRTILNNDGVIEEKTPPPGY
jgi:hypothetical protein